MKLNNDIMSHFLYTSPWIKLHGVDWSCVIDKAQLKKYKKNEVIFRQQEESPYVYVVKEGRVRMELLNSNGETKTVFIADKDSFFGELNHIDGGINMCNAVAISESNIYQIPHERFQEELRNNNEFCYSVMQLLSQKSRLLMSQVMQLSFDDSVHKVSYALLHLAQQYGVETPDGCRLLIKFTHQELGNLLGLSRVSVSNIMSDMYEKGLVVKKDNTLYIQVNKLLESVWPRQAESE